MLELSRREIEVAQLLSNGFSRLNVAAQLGLSVNTIREYIRRLYTKYGVCNRADLVRRFLQGATPVDNIKVDDVLRKYSFLLNTLGYPARRNMPEQPLPDDPVQRHDTVRRHLTWMCDEARSWPAERLEKKFRWLGFIQGAFWVEGLAVVTELKADNKPGE